jgi:hypothetical protein
MVSHLVLVELGWFNAYFGYSKHAGNFLLAAPNRLDLRVLFLFLKSFIAEAATRLLR